jgi:hypothetical protein
MMSRPSGSMPSTLKTIVCTCAWVTLIGVSLRWISPGERREQVSLPIETSSPGSSSTAISTQALYATGDTQIGLAETLGRQPVSSGAILQMPVATGCSLRIALPVLVDSQSSSKTCLVADIFDGSTVTLAGAEEIEAFARDRLIVIAPPEFGLLRVFAQQTPQSDPSWHALSAKTVGARIAAIDNAAIRECDWLYLLLRHLKPNSPAGPCSEIVLMKFPCPRGYSQGHVVAVATKQLQLHPALLRAELVNLETSDAVTLRGTEAWLTDAVTGIPLTNGAPIVLTGSGGEIGLWHWGRSNYADYGLEIRTPAGGVAHLQNLPDPDVTTLVPVIYTDSLRYRLRNDCADALPSDATLYLVSDGPAGKHELLLPMNSNGEGSIVVSRDGRRYWIEARSGGGSVLATSSSYASEGVAAPPLLIAEVCERRGGRIVRFWAGSIGQPGTAELFVRKNEGWYSRGVGHQIELALDDSSEALAVAEHFISRIAVTDPIVDCILHERVVQLRLPQFVGELAELEVAVVLRSTDTDLPNVQSYRSEFGRGGSVVRCSIPMAGSYTVDTIPRLSVGGVVAIGDPFAGGVGRCGIIVLGEGVGDVDPVAVDLTIAYLQQQVSALRLRTAPGKGR